MNVCVRKNSMDELLTAGDLDTLMLKIKDVCEKKVRGKIFAGMDTDDVVQEALVKVHHGIVRYDKSKSKVSTYVDVIIDNVIRDCLRKAGSGQNLAVVNAQPIVEYFDEAEDTVQGIQLGVNEGGYCDVEFMQDLMFNMRLSDREKYIFKLRSAGYEFAEIATALGLTRARICQLWRGIIGKYNALT